MFAGNGFAALAAMFTSSSNMLVAVALMTFGLEQVTLGTVPVHVQPGVEPALTEYPVTPAGSVSATVVVPVEFDGPLFVTVILYWPVPPAVKAVFATFVTARSKTEFRVVAGVETGPLLAALVSPGLLMLTVFGGSGFDAPAEMLMSSLSKLSMPDGIGFALVQMTFGTEPEHDQPAVEPAFTE